MIWDRGKYFLIPWLFCFSIGFSAILYYGKNDLHLILNAAQPRSADTFFKFATLLGEGWSLGLAIFYLLFRSRHGAGFLITSWLSSVLFIQLLKQTFFSDALRPASIFKDSSTIHFIEGVTYRLSHSFPSGHTGDVFSVCFALVLLSNKPRNGLILFIPALLVGYSRVFLSQHFMEDILAGSFIALCCTSLCFWFWWRNSLSFRNYINRH